MKKYEVMVLCGSEKDLSVVKETGKTLRKFGVISKTIVASAHRTPEKVARLARGAKGDGFKVIIAAAGMAAHLAGAVAANTTLPVIGVPLDVSPFKGLDALLSTMQMPSGVPVATVAVGLAGAKNAALLAIEILALGDKKLDAKLLKFKRNIAK